MAGQGRDEADPGRVRRRTAASCSIFPKAQLFLGRWTDPNDLAMIAFDHRAFRKLTLLLPKRVDQAQFLVIQFQNVLKNLGITTLKQDKLGCGVIEDCRANGTGCYFFHPLSDKCDAGTCFA